jgi:hypothetical protein
MRIDQYSDEALALLAVLLRGHQQGYEWLRLSEIEPMLGLELKDTEGRKHCRELLTSLDINGVIEERSGEFKVLEPEEVRSELSRLGIAVSPQQPHPRSRPSALAEAIERAVCSSV